MKLMMVGLVGLTMLVAAPASASFFDVFMDGYWSDPNYWGNPSDVLTGMYNGMDLYLDPNLYNPAVVPWDIDNPQWQVWNILGQSWDAWADPNNGLNLWCSTVPTFPYAFMGAMVNYPPFVYDLYPDMYQDPNGSETFFSKDKSHYIMAYARWKVADKGEGILGQHIDPAGWTGMFLGINKDATNPSPYVYMHCAPDGGLSWYGPGGRFNIDLEAGVWMLFQLDADGDTSVPNAPGGVPLWKSAVWSGDKYANAPAAWDDANYVMVSRADTGQPLVYKSFGSWQPNPSRYVFHEMGVSLLGAYAANANDLPAWCMFNGVEARIGEFSHVARRIVLSIAHSNWGTLSVNPDLRDPSDDPNNPDLRVFRYTDGTQVELSAAAITKKKFSGWTIFDPNYPGDPNRAVVDSNSVLRLTMDRDYQIQATFACASGVEPFLGFGMLVLVLCAAYRRLM
jgi:hypothetical protein